MSSPTSNIYRNDRILGLANGELDVSLYRHWGTALAKLLPRGGRFVVSRDGRKDSKQFKKALIEGLVREGIRVIDLGLSPSDLTSYAFESYQMDGLACVTGRSRPQSWNGLEWKLEQPELGFSEQVRQLRLEAENALFSSQTTDTDDDLIDKRKLVEKANISHDWTTWLQSVWYDTPCVPLRVVVDPLYGTWSGLARRTLATIFPQMSFEPLHDEVDPLFGNMIPDLRLLKTITPLCNEVVNRHADLGIILSGDAGAFMLVDSNGVPLQQDEIAWLVLHDLLADALDGESFLYDINCSEKVIDEGCRMGGRPILVPCQESAFVNMMRETGALIGLCSKGGIYFRGIQGNRIVVFAICWFLDYLSQIRTTLSEWRKSIPPFFTTPELYTPIASLEEVAGCLNRCWQTLPKQTLDGISYRLPCGRVNIRMRLDYSMLGFHFEGTDRPNLYQMVTESCHILRDLDYIGLFLNERFQTEMANRGL